MAVTNRSIKSSGGDNSDLADFESDINADEAIGDYWVGSVDEAYNADKVTINVSNANSAPHKITVGSSYRFTAHGNWPSCSGVEGTSARIEISSGNENCIEMTSPAWVVEWLMMSASGANSSGIFFDTGCNSTLRFCCIYDCSVYAVSADAGTLLLHNIFMWGNTSHVVMEGGTTNAYCCTTIGGTYAFRELSGTINIYGVMALGNTSSSFANCSGDYTVTTRNEYKGTHYHASVTATDWVSNVTGGSEDLHMVYSHAGFGDDWSATIGTTDIDGETTANSGDHVGADYPPLQSVSAGTESVVLDAPAVSIEAAAAGDANLDVSPVSLVLEAPACSISGAVSLDVSPVSVVLEAPACSISAATSLSVTPCEVVLEAPAATVTPGGVTLSVTPAEVVLDAPAVSVAASGGPQSLTVSTVSVVFEAPSVGVALASGPQSISCSPVSVVFEAPAVGISASVDLSVSPASVVLEGPAATVLAVRDLSVATKSITLEAPSVGISAAVTVSVTPVSVVFAGKAASISFSQTVTVATVSVVIETKAASISRAGSRELVRVILRVHDETVTARLHDETATLKVGGLAGG